MKHIVHWCRVRLHKRFPSWLASSISLSVYPHTHPITALQYCLLNKTVAAFWDQPTNLHTYKRGYTTNKSANGWFKNWKHNNRENMSWVAKWNIGGGNNWVIITWRNAVQFGLNTNTTSNNLMYGNCPVNNRKLIASSKITTSSTAAITTLISTAWTWLLMTWSNYNMSSKLRHQSTAVPATIAT